jgi:hypothetical protein
MRISKFDTGKAVIVPIHVRSLGKGSGCALRFKARSHRSGQPSDPAFQRKACDRHDQAKEQSLSVCRRKTGSSQYRQFRQSPPLVRVRPDRVCQQLAYSGSMNKTKTIFLKTGTAGIALNAVLLLSWTGCVGCVDGPRSEVVVESPAIVVQEDYVYYPSYGVYYSNSRHQYAYREGSAWVSRPAPPGISVDVLRASPSVKMDFHDSPANHHAAVARQYPKNWKPARSNPSSGQRDDHAGK